MNWVAAKPRTLVDHVIDEILAAAARGQIKPGARLVEKDLSASLNISRVPIREALRTLESQGVVDSEPYKGIRLMTMSHKKLADILDVRTSLEILAVTRALEAGKLGGNHLQALRDCLTEMHLMSDRRDLYGLARADTEFHLAMISLSENQPLITLWQSLARQLTVIIGWSSLEKQIEGIIAEHEKLIATLESGNLAAITAEISEHILTQGLNVNLDYFTDTAPSNKS